MRELSEIIESATKKALTDLFSNNEHFYYCALITTGEALPPTISAWSDEALKKYLELNNLSKEDEQFIKWSYAESPYLDFGSGHFTIVKEAFQLRPTMSHNMSDTQWNIEYQTRLTAMEKAMERLDQENFFSLTQNRNSLLINVEVVPPDHENTLRAIRLNPPQALTEWLAFIAEP